MAATRLPEAMTLLRCGRTRQAGMSMIEVLVALLIIVVGLLGLVGLQVRMQQAEFESYQRAQALVLLYDMVDRIHSHHVTAPCFAVSDAAGTQWLGTSATVTASCAVSNANDNSMALAAISEWQSLLLGAAETKGGASVGAMVGARGCVYYDTTSVLNDPTGAALPGTGLYTVAIAWQGTVDTFASTVNCGNGQYTGGETRRRVVSTSFRLAELK
jgi:type IV pilus assembly protein PilV